MRAIRSSIRACVLLLVAVVVFGAAVPLAAAQDVPGWLNKDENWQANKEKLRDFGEQFDNSWVMFESMRRAARGGKNPTWKQILEDPAFDWTGVYTGLFTGSFDNDQAPSFGSPPTEPPPSAKLTPEGMAAVMAKVERFKKTGGEYDPISDCRPPGTPRWFAVPFLREAAVTPQQTWLMNEMVNDVRRFYTDGRGHTPDEDAYATANGDTIAFWDGDMLVAHTRHLKAGQFPRGAQPNFSDQVTIVERWRKLSSRILQMDVWVFDPVNFAKPWYTRHNWTRLTDDDKNLRIQYWDCGQNPNNSVRETRDGTTDFNKFTFE